MIRFGSVCSGIEAASVAWNPLGWKAAWLSEIEPFPSAVLAHHYPDVPNLGDMTALPERIMSGEIEAPDVFCGGTPCQAFSVAGLRKSLDDARGNLSLTFCEIANAIDDVRHARGEPPAVIFWENVPGVLSTKDNAFGCFLAGLAGEDDPLVAPREKWTNAGAVYGPKRAVAWRVTDAQYFGVAQRRRRVFVVASARDGFDPAAVLFEFEGMRRDTAPRREAGQGTTHATAPCLTSSGRGVERTGDTRGQDPVVAVATFDRQSSGSFGEAPVAPTVAARDYKGPSDLVSHGIPGNWIGRAPENGGNAVEPMIDVSPCLTSADRHGVAQAMPINTMVALRHHALGERTGFGIGEAGDPAYTITKGHSHAVAQPVVASDVSPTLKRDYGTGYGDNEMDGGGLVMHPVGAFFAGQGAKAGSTAYDEHVSPTLKASDSGTNRTPSAHIGMAVRRLTPVECERLQGFPDSYTNIPWRKQPSAPDGPRYKALGNSWAVPNVRWIGRRIDAHLRALSGAINEPMET